MSIFLAGTRGAAFAAFSMGLALLAPSQLRAAAITITPTFDSSITTDGNAAGIEAAINNGIAEIESRIASAAALNVSITFSNATTGLGGSSQGLTSVPYAQYRTALAARATSANDALALSSLPVASTFNGFSNMALTFPHARALGFSTSADNATISLNTSITNLSRTGTQNASFYDLQTVAMHEMDEILGVGGPATTLGGPNTSFLGSLDVFRYSAPNTVSFSTSDTAYFSIDKGVTNIITYAKISGDDYADYASNPTHYVQDAVGTPGTYRDLATPELTSFDVIGYSLIPVPEPTSLAAAAVAVVMLRRRRTR